MTPHVDSDDECADDEFYDPAEYAGTHQHINQHHNHHIHINNQSINQHDPHDQDRLTRSHSHSEHINDQSINDPSTDSLSSASAAQQITIDQSTINQSTTNQSTNPSADLTIIQPIPISSINTSINRSDTSNNIATNARSNNQSTNQSINQSVPRPPASPSAHSLSSQREMSRELSNSSINIKRSASPRHMPNQSTNQSTNQSIDPLDQSSFPLRNLDTDEMCRLHDAQLFFPEIGDALTMDQLEAYERAKLSLIASPSQITTAAIKAANGQSINQSINPSEPVKLSESEVNERRRTLGILGKIAKTFSMSSNSSTTSSTKGIGGKVKTKAKHCQVDVFDDLVHAQTLLAANGPVWCVAVSHDGQFVATGGQDSIVRIWAIVGSMAARQLDERIRGETGEHQSINDPTHGRLIVHPTPFRVCSGHRADITCLSWSHSDDFLLSSSIDKTVCLWHVSSSRCIRVFPHTDLITCIAFHPREHRYFISGSFDNRIRLWNIIECRVVEWAQTAHFVTAVTFSPSGHMVVAGLHHGQCVFYATAGLKYHTQVDCRNRSGKHSKGKKVTGLEYSKDGSLLLVTTNDSRVRCYRMTDFGLHCKMKGVENESLQIKASLYEEQGQLHAICGSDKEICAVWKIPPAELQLHSHHRESENSTSRSQSQSYNQMSTLSPPVASTGCHAIKLDGYEYFRAIDDSPVTCALFMPTSSIAFSSANESQSALPIRHIVLASGLHGEIKIYENRIRPPTAYGTTQSKNKR